MKRPFTILASAILLAATSTSAAMATSSKPSPSEQPAPSASIPKEVNQELILQLKLNENQYIQLRALYRQYLKDLAQLKEADQATLNIEKLNEQYFAEVANVLSPSQLAAYEENPKQSTIAAEVN